MSEQIAEGATGVTDPDARYQCPECGQVFKSAMNLGSHRKHKHGVAGRGSGGGRKRTTTTTSTPGSSPRSQAARLKRDLKSGFTAIAMLPLMRNPNVLADERVRDIIDQRADETADAWVAVAQKDARVAKWLNTLLTGSVWINAGVASVTFTYSVAVFSGLAPLHPALTMVMPDLAQFIPQAQAASVAANGNGE